MSFVYRGLEAEIEHYIVTDHDVEHQIEHILEENHKCEHITDRPTKLGDEVILDYAGFCDGEQFEGGTAQHQHLTLGSGRFIPGFEEQLIGKNIGEEVIVSVTFPEVYHSDKLAGKAAEFHCTIHEIHVHTKYELNDEFAKEFGDCENMEEFREKLRSSMQAYSNERAEMELQDRLILQASETLDFEPTEEQIESEVAEILGQFSAELAQQGLNLEMYCQFTGSSVEQMKAEARENAVTTLKVHATVEKIAELENVTADEDEVNEALVHVARQNGITLEQLKELYNDEFKAAVVRSIVAGKVMRLVREAAEITVK